MKLKYNIPELTGLKQHSVLLAIKQVFMGGGPKDRLLRMEVNNFVRLVDLAVVEYELGRERIAEFVSATESVPLGAVLASINHFETCLVSVDRSIRHLRVLERRAATPSLCAILKTAIDPKLEKRIRDIRNQISHGDKDIECGRVKQGDSFMLFPREDELEIGEFRCRFIELASLLRELHVCSERVAGYREE